MGKRNLNKINKRKIKNKHNKSYKYIFLIAILILFSVSVLFILKYFLFSSIYAPLSKESSPVKINEVNISADINCKKCQDNGLLKLSTEKGHYLLYGLNQNGNKYLLNYDGKEVYTSSIKLVYSQLSSDGKHFYYSTFRESYVDIYKDGRKIKTISYPVDYGKNMPQKYIELVKINDENNVIYILHDYSKNPVRGQWFLMKDDKKLFEWSNLGKTEFMSAPFWQDILLDDKGENFLIKDQMFSSLSALETGDELPIELAIYDGKIVNQYKPLPNSTCCNNYQISPNGKHYKITIYAIGKTLVDGKEYKIAGNCSITNSGKLYCISSGYNGNKFQIFVNNVLFRVIDNFPKTNGPGIKLNENATHSIVEYVLTKDPNGSNYLMIDGKEIDTSIDFHYAQINGDNVYMYNYKFIQ